MIPSEVKSFFQDNSRFLISTHINPDGDGLGAAMGLKWAILKIGKEADIIIDSEPPDTFTFFENYHWVKKFSDMAADSGKCDAVVVIDAPNMERLGEVTSLFAKDARVLNIDHHISNEKFGHINYVDVSFASSTEMIYRIIKSFGLKTDKECAEYIYTGLIVDTGRFRFSNTKPETLLAASELVAAGAEPAKISELIFFNRTEETTRALGKFINSIELDLNGKVATVMFDYEYTSGIPWEKVDSHGFVNNALSIRGVEVAIFLREVEPGKTRVSLRAKNDFDVNILAGVFGGGGHAKAAGCTIEATLAEAKEKLLKETAGMLG